jgi:hypothetical protein
MSTMPELYPVHDPGDVREMNDPNTIALTEASCSKCRVKYSLKCTYRWKVLSKTKEVVTTPIGRGIQGATIYDRRDYDHVKYGYPIGRCPSCNFASLDPAFYSPALVVKFQQEHLELLKNSMNVTCNTCPSQVKCVTIGMQ